MPSLRYNLRNLTAVVGVVLTFVALGAANVSLDWAPFLAVASAVVAEYCWARLLWSSGWVARGALLVLSIPNALVVIQVSLRALWR
jgi:hypothetical protein